MYQPTRSVVFVVFPYISLCFLTDQKQRIRTQPQQKPASDTPVSPTLIPANPEPLVPPTFATANTEEIAFFDRAKKYIGNKQTFNELLKLLNLFSQDLIDQYLLINKVEGFLGGNAELMNWFKKFLVHKLEPEDEIVTNVPRRNQKVRLSTCRSLGPSYRLLPKLVRLFDVNSKCPLLFSDHIVGINQVV